MPTPERAAGPDVPITSVEASAYTIPTDRPEGDGTLTWDATTWVLVTVRVGDPALPSGLGWSYAPAPAAAVVRDLLADVVVGRSALDVRGTWEAVVRAVRNAGRPGLVSMAISAVDTALWDLEARLLGLPLHRLLGSVRDDVPIYGSGGFTTDPEDLLREQVDGWVSQGIPRVKIKIGESWGGNARRDLERVRLVRQTVGPDVEVYVDANGGYTAQQAVRLGRSLDEHGVTWFEEPVSSDDHTGLRRVREGVTPDVAAGEYGDSLAYFAHLLAGETVDCVQVDVTRCGGYTEWLRIVALAAAYGLEVSGHCSPALHAPVAMATPNLRHLEWFEDHVRIEERFLDGFPTPEDGAIMPPDSPGHGLAVRTPDLAAYGGRCG
ncbi:enolase C-terminal domain-like protein [Nocardioides sp.]|jgi:L-alanine-DL-glutamate epimerase-like enolase superfamily enzyme|uniref:enolase C-terminal domain-like protein n=1 Tax=Nocardioides sp. TaxID=35761 RepID=UPI002F42A002